MDLLKKPKTYNQINNRIFPNMFIKKSVLYYLTHHDHNRTYSRCPKLSWDLLLLILYLKLYFGSS